MQQCKLYSQAIAPTTSRSQAVLAHHSAGAAHTKLFHPHTRHSRLRRFALCVRSGGRWRGERLDEEAIVDQIERKADHDQPPSAEQHQHRTWHLQPTPHCFVNDADAGRETHKDRDKHAYLGDREYQETNGCTLKVACTQAGLAWEKDPPYSAEFWARMSHKHLCTAVTLSPSPPPRRPRTLLDPPAQPGLSWPLPPDSSRSSVSLAPRTANAWRLHAPAELRTSISSSRKAACSAW